MCGYGFIKKCAILVQNATSGNFLFFNFKLAQLCRKWHLVGCGNAVLLLSNIAQNPISGNSHSYTNTICGNSHTNKISPTVKEMTLCGNCVIKQFNGHCLVYGDNTAHLWWIYE